MKKLLLAILLAASLPSLAQQDSDIESMMTRRVLRCSDVQYNSIALIPRLYRSGRNDTLEALLAYAHRHCPNYNGLLDFELLYAIGNGTFREEQFTGRGLLASLRSYGRYFDEGQNDAYITLLRNDEIVRNYYNLLREMAHNLSQSKLTPGQDVLVRYYSTPADSLLELFNDREFRNTAFQTEYRTDRERFDPRTGYHYSILGGVWAPDGKLSLLGNHPYLGFQMGGRGRKLMINVTVMIKFLQSKNSYLVRKEDSLYSTRRFLGGYIGLDGAYSLLQGRHHTWDVLGGVGWDGFDALSVDRNDERLTKSVNSINFNVGTGYKYFFGKAGTYVGLDAKYNFLFYKNTGGTRMSGNAFTIGLVFGFSGNHNRSVPAPLVPGATF